MFPNTTLFRSPTLQRDGERFEADLAEAEERLSEVLSLLSAGERETEEAKQRVMDLQDTLSDVRIHLHGLRSDAENASERQQKIAEERLQLGRERDRLGMQREELDTSLRKIRAEITRSREALEKEEAACAEGRKQADSLRVRREELAREHGAKTSRHHVLSELEQSMEGYSHSVKALLSACREKKELGRGIHGALAQLVHVDPEFETALEVCQIGRASCRERV